MDNLDNYSDEQIKEILAIESSRRGFPEYCVVIDPKYQLEWFHEQIALRLERAVKQVEAGEDVRLMIFMPPRHGKSDTATQKLPSWALGIHPDWPFIISSYSSELATDFGQGTRDLMDSPTYRHIFDTKLREDTTAKAKWMTEEGGGYTSVGVGGAITGRGFKIGIIDDPFKNREEADSPVTRESVHKWYRSTFYTRQEGNTAIILILCMVGDTNVRMADGTEKFLKDIRIGDEIATYDNGNLSSSFVKNWVNHGSDTVFAVTMSSGRIVRANARHPFLTNDNGKLTWTRLKDLTTHHKIVMLKDSGVNGKVRNASTKNVTSQQSVEDIALLTIIKRNGLMAIDHLQLTVNRIERHVSNIVMALLPKSTTDFLKNRMESVPFVNSYQTRTSGLIGEGNSVLTMTTPQAKSERYYAITAILPSVMLKIKRLLWQWLNISEFTLDNIVSITEDGIEDVFDIQVERTENFIANGLVSHNTRWHDDDLAGRLLKEQVEAEKNGEEDYDKWEVLEFKALAESDEPNRKKGEALWPAKFNESKLLRTKSSIGSYEWSALYQQNPIDEENQEFKKEWLKYRTLEDVLMMQTRKFATIDPAGSKHKKSDSTGVTRNYVNNQNEWHIESRRYRINSKGIIDLIFQLHDEGFEQIGIEEGVYKDAIEPFLKVRMDEIGVYPNIITLKHNGIMKETRIRGLIPRYENGKIFHIGTKCADLEEEYLRFPKSAHDDCLDATAYQNQIAVSPSASQGDILTYDEIAKGITSKINPMRGNILVGVSGQSTVHIVIGNSDGLFFNGALESDKPEELQKYISQFERCYIIVDSHVPPLFLDYLKEKNNGRVFVAYFAGIKNSQNIVRWGKRNEYGDVEISYDKLLQSIIDEFSSRRLVMSGSKEDWNNYINQFSALFRVWETDASGNKQFSWETNSPSGFINATLYFRAGMTKFGETMSFMPTEIFEGIPREGDTMEI